jgi:hypothetical protein
MQEEKKQQHEKHLEALSKPKRPTEKFSESSYKDGRYILYPYNRFNANHYDQQLHKGPFCPTVKTLP